MGTFRDHFSGHAGSYAQWRPRYPAEMFAWIASLVPQRRTAWDCATGNGQAAGSLAESFDHVVATDASLDQLAHAGQHGRVTFHAAEATASALADDSVDLVTVAQALHWFDLEPFEREVRRVLVPHGVLVAWTYEFFRVNGEIDAVMREFGDACVGTFWPPERRHVDARYATLVLEMEPIQPPTFVMRAEWNLDQLLAYVGTWSAVRRFRRARGFDPVSDLEVALEPLWGKRQHSHEIRWRLTVLAGRP